MRRVSSGAGQRSAVLLNGAKRVGRPFASMGRLWVVGVSLQFALMLTGSDWHTVVSTRLLVASSLSLPPSDS